jgi:hypothetical protein
VVVLILLIVCSYLNLSYFLQYATEVPEWKRSPESVLQQTESIRSAIEELKTLNSQQEEALRKAWQETKFPFDRLLASLDNPGLVNLSTDLESRVSRLLQGGTGLIYVESFNQISKAIRRDPKTNFVVGSNIPWDQLAKQIVDRVS